MKTLPPVSIVIANFNGRKYLDKCLFSLLNLNYPKNSLEIILVDNGSSDDSVEFVKNQYAQVTVIQNKVNNYCMANNLGIKASKNKYIAFINNDTYVDKNWLIELIRIIETDKEIGCVGSKILFSDGRINSVGHQEFPGFYWGDLGFREIDNGQYDEVREVMSLCGCAYLFRRSCLDEIGNFDEDFGMYLEDIDMALRCQKADWKLFFVPKSIIYHNFHGSSDGNMVRFQVERNRLLLITKHFPDKLAESLFGKGYFIDGKNDTRILEILPLILSKLSGAHDIEIANKNISHIFEELKKIFNFQRDHSIQTLFNERECLIRQFEEKERGLNTQLQNLQSESRQHKILLENMTSQISAYKQQFESLNSKLQNLEAESLQGKALIQDITNQNLTYKQQLESLSAKLQNLEAESLQGKALIGDITSQNSVLRQQLKLSNEQLQKLQETLTFKSQELAQNISKLLLLEKESEKKTDRFLLNGITKIKNILIIKPQRIELNDTVSSIKYFKEKFKGAKVSLVANLLKKDYEVLSNNKMVDRKLLYSPDFQGAKRFNLFEILKLSSKLKLKGFDLVIILVNALYYPGYKNAVLLSNLVGYRKRFFYFPKDNIQTIHFNRRQVNVERAPYFQSKMVSEPANIGIFQAKSKNASFGINNYYSVKVVNNSNETKVVNLLIRLYSSDRQGVLKGQCASFCKRLLINPVSFNEITINFNWQDTPAYTIDGNIFTPDFKWFDRFNKPQLYAIEASIYDIFFMLNDKLTIYQELT